ncbi:MAG: hypothetical protein J6S21_08205, partial [Victivallales bacterium]|nr:hypothetical protein [Victivallales bacterium]
GHGFEDAQQIPMPPFSAMFGVKECFLVNSGNIGDTATVSGDAARLSVDMRGVESDPVWVIAVNSDMTLFFKAAVGEGALNYCYLAPAKDNDWVQEAGEFADGDGRLSLKAGTMLALSTAAIDFVPEVTMPADAQYVFMWKMKVEDEEGGSRDEIVQGAGSDVLPDTAAGVATTINIAAGDEKVKVVLGDSEYVESGVSADECRWICTVNLPEDAELSGSPAFADGKFTFSTAAAANYSISMEAMTTGVAPVTTAIYNGDALVANVNWIVVRFGTLDFDGDGDVDNDDAMYLYNFVGYGCPGAEEDWFDGVYLESYTSGPAVEVLNAALETMRSMGDDLDFDLDGDVDNDDAMYLYNFVGYGCPGAEEDWFDGVYLESYTSGPSVETLNTALETMRGMLE